jgi:hypothetical protein
MSNTPPAPSSLQIVIRDRDGRTISEKTFESQSGNQRLVEVKAPRSPR